MIDLKTKSPGTAVPGLLVFVLVVFAADIFAKPIRLNSAYQYTSHPNESPV